MQGILPIQAQSHGIGRRAIALVLQRLECEHKQQIDRWQGRFAFGMIEVGKRGVVVEGIQLVADQAVGALSRQQRGPNPRQIMGHRTRWLRFERHQLTLQGLRRIPGTVLCHTCTEFANSIFEGL